MECETYLIPDHFLPALVNGDLTGLESEDLEALRLFIAAMAENYGRFLAVDYDEEPVFTAWHDMLACGVLSCNCVHVTFDITKRN